MGSLAYIPWKGIPFRVNCCTWCKIRVQPHSFVHGRADSPTEWSGILVKDHLTVYARVSFWASCSVPLVHLSVFMPAPHKFDHCRFAICFEIRKYEFPTFLLFFKIIFTIQGPCLIFFMYAMMKKKKPGMPEPCRRMSSNFLLTDPPKRSSLVWTLCTKDVTSYILWTWTFSYTFISSF